MQWPNAITDRIGRETHFGSRNIKCFSERPQSVNVMFTDALHHNSNSEAVVSADTRLTYTVLDQKIAALAAGLRENGLSSGDRIAMLIGNRSEFVVVLLAALRIGAIAVPINIREQTPELTYILNDCGAKLLIHDHDIALKLPAPDALQHVQKRFSIGGATEYAKDFTSLSIIDSSEQNVVVDEEDVAIILYTSGTTGLPKGAMLTHLNIVHSCMHFEYCMALGEGERSLLAVPASHVTGVIAVLLTMVRVAGCSVILETFKAEDAMATASSEKITHTILVALRARKLQPD